jgi:hypothetical protein
MSAEHDDLFQHLVAVIDLGISGGKNLVPKEGHLFFQGPLGGNHIEEPGEHSYKGLTTR